MRRFLTGAPLFWPKRRAAALPPLPKRHDYCPVTEAGPPFLDGWLDSAWQLTRADILEVPSGLQIMAGKIWSPDGVGAARGILLVVGIRLAIVISLFIFRLSLVPAAALRNHVDFGNHELLAGRGRHTTIGSGC